MTNSKKARDLAVGDVFRLHVYGEVIHVSQAVDGKRIKVAIRVDDQGSELEFTNAGFLLEFLCRLGRQFHIYDNDGDEGEPTEDTGRAGGD
jgi:hypothetical protein